MYERHNFKRVCGDVTVRITGIKWCGPDSYHPVSYRGTVNVPGFKPWHFTGLAPSTTDAAGNIGDGWDSPQAVTMVARLALSFASVPNDATDCPGQPSPAFVDGLEAGGASYTADNGETVYILAAA